MVCIVDGSKLTAASSKTILVSLFAFLLLLLLLFLLLFLFLFHFLLLSGSADIADVENTYNKQQTIWLQNYFQLKFGNRN